MASRVAALPQRQRCAIYTRKSTEDGLEQAFNSLDAQREACAAYIASQRHEGWGLVETAYDDGGFSGGSLDRPALKALLADVAAGRVDTILVYKIDRLTRSLADFSRIVDVLDEAGASFVSVTQAFNTTTSMGRLTLNVLLSFAQFEREVTGERIRDKIAASKAKGMWMGGVVPLGYRVELRKLVIDEAEARTVRHIFTRYLALGSVAALAAELDGAGIGGRARKHRGVPQPPKPLSRGALYLSLRNRIYLGEIVHKGTSHPGEHDALMEPDLFERVQALLDDHRVAHRSGSGCSDPSLLAGLIGDVHGRAMSPSHASKDRVRRYRYYVSRSDGSATPLWRLPAGEIEALVTGRIRALLADTAAVMDAVAPLQLDAVALDAALFAAQALGRTLGTALPHAVRQQLQALGVRVSVAEDRVTISLSREALGAGEPHLQQGHTEPVRLEVAGRFARVGKEVRLVVPPSSSSTSAPPRRDPGLIKLVVKAHAARMALIAGAGRSVAEIAREQGHAKDYFTVLLRIAHLAPELTAAILDGRQPQALTRQKLARMPVPLVWEEQGRDMAGGSGAGVRATRLA